VISLAKVPGNSLLRISQVSQNASGRGIISNRSPCVRADGTVSDTVTTAETRFSPDRHFLPKHTEFPARQQTQTPRCALTSRGIPMRELDSLVHLPVVASKLGYESARPVKELCKRHHITLYRLNGRINAIREADYPVLLALLVPRKIAS
jgi:hypothetical protein